MHLHENDCNNVLFLTCYIYNIRMRTGVHFLTKEGNFLLRNEFFKVQQTSMSFSMGSFEFCYFFWVPLACLKSNCVFVLIVRQIYYYWLNGKKICFSYTAVTLNCQLVFIQTSSCINNTNTCKGFCAGNDYLKT